MYTFLGKEDSMVATKGNYAIWRSVTLLVLSAPLLLCLCELSLTLALSPGRLGSWSEKNHVRIILCTLEIVASCPDD